MIYIQDHNQEAITQYLKLAGLRCNYYKVRDFARKCETNFSNNSVPEQRRIETGCSKVWSDERGAYQFTIKRTIGGYWALISAKGEPFQKQDKEGVAEAILKTASETSNYNLVQGSGAL